MSTFYIPITFSNILLISNFFANCWPSVSNFEKYFSIIIFSRGRSRQFLKQNIYQNVVWKINNVLSFFERCSHNFFSLPFWVLLPVSVAVNKFNLAEFLLHQHTHHKEASQRVVPYVF